MQLAQYAWGFLAGTGATCLWVWLVARPTVGPSERYLGLTAIVVAFILGNAYIVARILGG